MKINKKTAIIIIGFGSIGRRHYNNLLRLGYHNVSVFDQADDVFAGFANVERVEHLNSEVLKNFEIAFICSPNNLHVKHAIMCVQVGCQIFIEKPLSHNLQDVDKLISNIKEKEIIGMVACNMRFHPCLKFIKEYINKGRLGKVYSINNEFGYYLPYWRPQQDYSKNYAAKRKTGGGIILDDIHEFDLLMWLNNFEKIAETRFLFDKSGKLKIETEDNCLATFKFKNRVLGLVKCDYLQQAYSRKCKIVGERGNLEWDFKENIVWLNTKDKSINIFSAIKFDFNQVYLDEVSYFFRCLAEEKETFNNLELSSQILRICLARK
jgi:predicted dehydrogenase